MNSFQKLNLYILNQPSTTTPTICEMGYHSGTTTSIYHRLPSLYSTTGIWFFKIILFKSSQIITSRGETKRQKEKITTGC